MTTDIEKIAAILDPEIWAIETPTPTREATEDFYRRRRESSNLARRVLASLAQPRPEQVEDEAVREAVRIALESELGDAYDCMRVWEAWHVGTMTENDFEPVTSRIDEITETVIAALARPAPKPTGDVPVRRRVRHKKRGGIYEVLGEAQVQTSHPLEDYEIVVIYRSLNTPNMDDPASPMKGDIWVRPRGEFEDGRFEDLAATPAPVNAAPASEREGA